MKQSIISAGQSLVDVALQELGSVEALFALADANGLAITDALRPGQALSIPDAAVALPDVAAYFVQRGQRINTNNASAVDDETPIEAGIFDETYAPVFE